MLKKKENKGITLIALVITVIILLILAGVTIATLTGDNGILTKASEAREQTEIAVETEAIKLAYNGAITGNKGEGVTSSQLQEELRKNGYANATALDNEDGTITVTFETGNAYTVDTNGNVSEYIDIADYIKVGDYVNYNPTISDKNGTQVESNKLTYTSPTGSGTEHGNGYTSSEIGGGQKFTATANTKWRVLNIENGKIQLISENVIKTDVGSDFVMSGAVGYLYAERELNEICKIYGYGYGADTSQVTQYNYGGPLEENLTGQITGSGARSIRIDDINNIVGIYEDKDGIIKFSDGTVVHPTYGVTTKPETNVYYPTISTSTGKSNEAGVKNLKYTNYAYNNERIGDSEIQSILCNGRYWVASRCIASDSSSSSFKVFRAYTYGVYSHDLCSGNDSLLSESSFTDYSVRPVVTIESNAINIQAGYNEQTGWNLN